jgi:signal transduction histidine kinase
MQKISNLNALDQESLFAVVKSIPDGLIIMDEKGAPLYFNRPARQLLSLKEQKASLHQYLLQILDFDPLSVTGEEKIKARVHGAFYQVLVCPFQSRHLHRGIILFFKDISALLEAEEMKTEFISIASHELRNPITAVNNALEILSSKETGEINPEQESFLKIAARNMHRIAALVEEYLDLSRIEVGKQTFQYSTVKLDDFFQPLVEECRAKAGTKKITFSMAIPPKIPQVIADPYKLEQIFYNLFDNALKYSNEGGSITVTAREVKRRGSGQGQDIRHKVEVVIADTGTGIPEDKKKLIFEKFYRVNKSLEKEKGGAGLGLAIVKKLVEKHGGEIYVQDNKPAGSRFCFSLLTAGEERRNLGFRLIFDREFQKARKTLSSLSLIAIVVERIQIMRQRRGGEKMDVLLNKVCTAISESLYHKADTFVHYKKGEIFVIFCEAEKNGAQIIRQRIEERVQRLIQEQYQALVKDFSLHIGIAVYPDDADNQRDLFRMALHSNRGDENGEEENTRH